MWTSSLRSRGSPDPARLHQPRHSDRSFPSDIFSCPPFSGPWAVHIYKHGASASAKARHVRSRRNDPWGDKSCLTGCNDRKGRTDDCAHGCSCSDSKRILPDPRGTECRAEFPWSGSGDDRVGHLGRWVGCRWVEQPDPGPHASRAMGERSHDGSGWSLGKH
jgi:hypothetical protein